MTFSGFRVYLTYWYSSGTPALPRTVPHTRGSPSHLSFTHASHPPPIDACIRPLPVGAWIMGTAHSAAALSGYIPAPCNILLRISRPGVQVRLGGGCTSSFVIPLHCSAI